MIPDEELACPANPQTSSIMTSMPPTRPVLEFAGMNRRDTIRLCTLPTPFERMPRLSLALGRDGQIPSIWVKRYDCTGFAGGGNKARKLEYLVADALIMAPMSW